MKQVTNPRHGTAVASVAAAIRSLHNSSAHGVAWGADIAMFTIPLGSIGISERWHYDPITLNEFAGVDQWWTALFTTVLGAGPGFPEVNILNLGIGYSEIINSYGEQELRDNFGQAIETMAQADANEKSILVWAAGNAHGDWCYSGTDNCVD